VFQCWDFLGRDETALVERSPRLTSALGFNDQLPINALTGEVVRRKKDLSGCPTQYKRAPLVE